MARTLEQEVEMERGGRGDHQPSVSGGEAEADELGDGFLDLLGVVEAGLGLEAGNPPGQIVEAKLGGEAIEQLEQRHPLGPQAFIRGLAAVAGFCHMQGPPSVRTPVGARARRGPVIAAGCLKTPRRRGVSPRCRRGSGWR
jgi:hypothetical protein